MPSHTSLHRQRDNSPKWLWKSLASLPVATCLFLLGNNPSLLFQRSVIGNPHHPSCLKFFIRHPHHLSFPKSFIGNPEAFKYLWTPRRTIQGWHPFFVIPEIFYRESTSSVMPEIFYQASTFLLFLFVFMFLSFQGGVIMGPRSSYFTLTLSLEG